MTFDPVFRRHSPCPPRPARRIAPTARSARARSRPACRSSFGRSTSATTRRSAGGPGAFTSAPERIKRPIPEGADLELTVRIDASRKMTVELFVPALNQSFAEHVYIPDPPAARSKLQQELDLCFERLDRVRREIYEADREDVIPEFEPLQARAEQIAEHAARRAPPRPGRRPRRVARPDRRPAQAADADHEPGGAG